MSLRHLKTARKKLKHSIKTLSITEPGSEILTLFLQ